MPKTTKTLKKAQTKKVATQGRIITRYRVDGEKVTPLKVPKTISEIEVKPALIAQAVRIYRIRARQGTQFTKTRSEVIGSTRKIYRQKGTGRARHGDIKAPIFVGGGIIFGPKPREFAAKLNQKTRHKLLLGLLKAKIENGKMLVLTGMAKASGKTKDMNALLNKLNVSDKNTLVILTKELKNAERSLRNLKAVTISNVEAISPLEILRNEELILAEEAWDKLSQRFSI